MESEAIEPMGLDRRASLDRVIDALDREFTATMGTPLAVLWDDLGNELANLRDEQVAA